MTISIIAAMDLNRGIGKNNELLWGLPNDMKYFKEKTMGKTVVMGRKTAESIGSALPDRKNIVLSTQGWHCAGFYTQKSVQEILDHYAKYEDIMVIGGAEIYKQFLPHAEVIYMTHVWAQFEADSFFPDVRKTDWKVVSSDIWPPTLINPYPHSFSIYRRL
jgi:dihydrofolate reductase